MKHILLLSTLAAAILGALSVQLYLRRFEREATGGPKLPVIVLLGDVSAGTTLGRSQLGSREIPEAYRDSRHIDARELERLVGAKIVVPGRANEALLWTDLASARRTERRLSELVPPGMRAITITQRNAGIDALLAPGDRVDLLRSQPKEGAPRTVAEDLLVLALGDRVAEAGATPGRGRGPVTLSVTLEQAAAIAAAEREASLRLVLRHPDDLTLELRDRAPAAQASIGGAP